MIKEVIVLDSLYRINVDASKSKNRKVPVGVARQILSEYKELAKAEAKGPLALAERIEKLKISDNGKKMASTINIFKYRLNSGDRILYTYSKHIPYLKSAHPSALVLLQYEQHDDQGFDAKNYQLSKKRKYKKVKDLVKEYDDLAIAQDSISDEDLTDIFEMLEPSFGADSAKYVVTDEAAKDRSLVDWDVILVPKQNEYKLEFEKKKSPMLVLGGAGSGKTVLATHILGDFNGENAIYLTQSDELRNKTERQFRGLYPNKENVEFYNINDFCTKALGLRDRDYIRFRDFESFFEQDAKAVSLKNELGISTFDVWTEIRGTIKGSLYPIWTRNRDLNQTDYHYIDDLIHKGYLCRPYKDKRFNLADNVDVIRAKFVADDSKYLMEKDELDELESIIQYFESFDAELPRISIEAYESMPDENSTVVRGDRSIIYQICERYDQFLGGKKYDDNDLARKTIGRISEIKKRYDLIIVDEIQDYTEMQIYLTFLLRGSNSVFYAGDVHQLINPTMFREGRIKDLFFAQKDTVNLATRYLDSNFRCQQGIVDVANEFAEIRRKTIGSMSAEGEQLQKSKRNGSKPFRLNYSDSNALNICKTLINYPRTAILVPNEQVKEELIDAIGRKEYADAKNSIIFTIPEIKGMEYRYVLCYDLFGANKEMWDSVVFNKASTHQTRLRYYFNLIYVAMTRAQDNLCFIDRKIPEKIENHLSLIPVEAFDIVQLEIVNLSDSLEEWIAAAEDYESNGNYKAAIENYERGESPKENIYRCKGLLAYDEHNYEDAAKYFLLAVDDENCKRAYENLDKTSNMRKLIDAISIERNISAIKSAGNIADLIRKCFKGFGEEENAFVFELALSAIDVRIEMAIDEM